MVMMLFAKDELVEGLTMTGAEVNATLAEAEAAIRLRLARMSIDDWRRVRERLDAAVKRLPSHWAETEKTLDGIVCDSKLGFRVILSGCKEDDGKLWMHLSLSRRGLLPMLVLLAFLSRIRRKLENAFGFSMASILIFRRVLIVPFKFLAM
jgi:hypothetical protein